MRSRVLALSLVTAVAGALAACGGSTDGSGRTPAGSDLEEALRSIRASPVTLEEVMFGRPAAATALLPEDRRKRLFNPYFGIPALGTGPLIGVADDVRTDLGVDLSQARYGYTAGVLPNRSGAVVGVDTMKLTRTLSPLAVAVSGPDDRKLIRVRRDDDIGDGDRFERSFPRIARDTTLNVVRATPSRFAYASSREDLGQVETTTGRTLYDVPEVARVARCLGYPLGAVLLRAPRGYVPPIDPPARLPQPPAPSVGVTYLGMGSYASGTGPVERLCVATGTAGQARTLAAQVRATLSDGVLSDGRPWSKEVASSTVSTSGALVSVSLRFTDPSTARMLYDRYTDGDLPGVYGR